MIGVQFNDADFEMFKEECRWWLARFGMSDWDVDYFNQLPNNAGDSMACTSCSCASMRAMIYFNKETDSVDVLTMSKEELIKMCAQHEVIELLLSTFEYLAKQRAWDEDAWQQENHRVIHRIRHALREGARDVLREAIKVKQQEE